MAAAEVGEEEEGRNTLTNSHNVSVSSSASEDQQQQPLLLLPPSLSPSSHLLHRLLRHLRSVSVRNLASVLLPQKDASSSSSPTPQQQLLLPSTYIQVLLRRTTTTTSAAAEPWHLCYTSEVAYLTYNPTWLVLDINVPSLPAVMKEERPQEGAGAESEAEEEEVCIRVFSVASTSFNNQEETDNNSITAATSSTGSNKSSKRRRPPLWAAPPPLPGHTHQPKSTDNNHTNNHAPPLVAEFIFRADRLWRLSPVANLAHLHLPLCEASCLLATGEGGRGLLVPEELYLAACGGGGNLNTEAGHLLDEAYLEELEEFHRHLPFLQGEENGGNEETQSMTMSTGANQEKEQRGGEMEENEEEEEEEGAEERRREVSSLQALLQVHQQLLSEEEQALAREEEGLREEATVLEAERERVQDLNKEAEMTRKEIAAKEEELLQKGFYLETRQRKLLGELATIYPIERRSGEQDYRIRGLELSNDIVSSTRDDEHVAAALGYVSHLVFMLSKYLQVPLRYALECKSSRSMIRDATVAMDYAAFPLYRRGVERERFEWAVYLLKKDIQQLLYVRGVPLFLQGSGGPTRGGGGGGMGGGGGGSASSSSSPSSLLELNGAHLLQNIQALFQHELASKF